ncbi:hypothetical protein HYT05_00665 [Candidatus Kaiserbacteria bacterium]|nr:hypothetical protein [Candidatus Kaiserbacteria bacterium]
MSGSLIIQKERQMADNNPNPKPDKTALKTKVLTWLGFVVVLGVVAFVAASAAVKMMHPGTTTTLTATAPSKEEAKAPTLSPKEKEEAEWKAKVQESLAKFGDYVMKQEEARKAASATNPQRPTEAQIPQGDPRMQQPQGGDDGWQGGRQANGRRRALSPAEIAAQAYESLGPAPSDAPLKNHQKVAKKGSGSFTCPDGSPGISVKRVENDGRGMGHARWFCP